MNKMEELLATQKAKRIARENREESADKASSALLTDLRKETLQLRVAGSWVKVRLSKMQTPSTAQTNAVRIVNALHTQSRSARSKLPRAKTVKPNPMLEMLKREKAAANKRIHRAEAKLAEPTDHSTLAWAEHLREYQQLSVHRALANWRTGRPVLDASEMGLGKTRMCGAFLATVERNHPGRINRVLWLTAKSVTGDTLRELNGLGLMVVPVKENNFEAVSKAIDAVYPDRQVVFITNYEAMGSMSKKQAERGVLRNYKSPSRRAWDCLVVDEVTKLKGGANPSGPTIIWQMVHDLRYDNPDMFPYFLSGTPIENHPNDVWAYMHIFNKQIFPDLGTFERAFTSTDARGELKLNNEALFELLKSFIIRNTYESCGVEMPLTTETKLECELEVNSEIYQVHKSLTAELALWLASQPDKGIRVSMLLEQLLRQRQILVTGPEFTYTKAIYDDDGNKVGKLKETLDIEGPYPKVDVALNKTMDLLDQNEPVVIFCCFNEPLEFLKNRFREFGVTAEIINGSTSQHTPKYVEAFQDGKLNVLLINKLSGAYGLNLQKCDKWVGGSSHMIHLDRWWNPAKERQAIARLVRMNTNAPVFIYYCHVNGTVDDFMLELNQIKQKYADDVDSEITLDKSDVKRMLGL